MKRASTMIASQEKKMERIGKRNLASPQPRIINIPASADFYGKFSNWNIATALDTTETRSTPLDATLTSFWSFRSNSLA